MAVHHGSAKVAPEDTPHVGDVLHRQGLVDAELFLQLLDLLSSGLGASCQPHRVAGDQMRDGEGYDGQSDEDRYDEQEPSNQVVAKSDHLVL